MSMTARLTEERAQAVPEFLQRQECGTTETVSDMASAAAVTLLGLLHMRPLQHWLHSRVPRWAWRRGTLRVGISQQCRRSLSPWTDLAFLWAGVPLEQVSQHTFVTTDASSTGWGATCNGQATSGELNRAADTLSRQLTFPGEWRLHPETIRLIWSRFGEAQVDLFASPESSHCQLYFSLTEGPLGTDALAHSWPRALHKYAFPLVSLLAQTLCKLREDEKQVLLVAPHWPTRTWFPELISLATARPWRIPLRKDLLSEGLGTIWHPRPDLWNLHVWLLDETRQT